MNKPSELPPGVTTEAAIRFEVNGRAVEVGCPPTTRLSDCLRDTLGLTGTKVGCQAGDCGACTVLVDGEQVCACLVGTGQIAGHKVLTVEGLADADGRLSRLQQKFLEHGAAQCGICTPGMLMAACDTLARHPAPTEQQVLDGIGGVLCRCTGYRKIVEAVLDAAPAATRALAAAGATALADAASGAAVGARVVRLDGPAKLTGAERYGADDAPAGSAWLRVVRSPHSRARFRLGDVDAWVADHPGVIGHVTAADVPNNRFAIFPDLRDQPAIAAGHVRFLGEAVLVLVGSREALEGLDIGSLPIAWSVEPAVIGTEAALAAGAAAVHDRWPDNVLCRGRVVRGDVDAGLASGALVATAAMQTGYVEHAYIEPEAGWARWSLEDGVPRVHVFACTQTPYMDRDELASMFMVPADRVRVVPSAVGGGFGGKLDISIQPLLVAASRKYGCPTRIVYDRPESMLSTTKRHPSRMRASLAASDDGTLVAYDFQGDFNTGAYSSWGPTVANRVPIHASGPYRIVSVRALTRAVLTNDAIAGAFRGFGVPQATLLNERLIDEIAVRLGRDPLEFRHQQALRAGDSTACGQRLQASVGLQACLDRLRPAWASARADAERFNAAQRAERPPAGLVREATTDPHLRYAGAKRRGVGIACMWYGIGNTVIANPSTMRIGLRPNGRFVLYNGAVEIGQGTATIMPQMAADALGVPLAALDQTGSDTSLTEDAGKSSASRQTFVSGNAVRAAGLALRARLLERLGAPADARLVPTPGLLLALAGDRRYELPLDTLPVDARGDVFDATGYFDPPTVPLDADGQGVPYATYGFAAQFAQVEVDIELGTVRVLSIHAAHDVGRAINPTQVEGQVHGGIAQGLGLALMEEYVPGRTDNLHDYLIPTAGDMPPIVVHLVEDPEPLGPWGAKGVGEPALVATAPAILNAIHHAAGVRLDQVPATPERVLRAIRAARETRS